MEIIADRCNMKRKVYQQLLKWKEEQHGESAILINGARRVGKSYIVKEFARNEYKSYILLDFNKIGSDIKALFENHLNDLDTFFMYLSSFTNTIDFLIVKDRITTRHNISPIEVKSTNRYTLSSLKKCIAKYGNYLAMPYVIHTSDLKIKDGITYLPLYMAGLL